MIRAILLDDELHVIEELKHLIFKYFGESISIVAEATSVREGVLILQKFQPDLLFLDINFRDGTGFDIIDKIANKNFNVIFITGFDKFALKAIKTGALDYIIKPIDEKEFQIAVYKAIEDYKKNASNKKQLEVSQEHYKGEQNKRVIFTTSESIYAVYEDDILYCKSDGNYTTIYMRDSETILVSKYIKKMEELLSEDTFIRCHRSFIVNKKHILKYNRDSVFILPKNVKVPISRSFKEKALKKAFS